MRRRVLGLLCSRVDHDRGLIDGRNEFAQLLDRVIEGIGDRAGDFRGNRGLHGKVTIGEAAHLVEQAQNCLLVAFILFALVASLLFESRHAHVQKDKYENEHYGKQGQSDNDNGIRKEAWQDPGTARKGVRQVIGRSDYFRLRVLDAGQLVDVCTDGIDLRLEVGQVPRAAVPARPCGRPRREVRHQGCSPLQPAHR